MAYAWQINDLPKKGQAHAFCAANETKGYLSTSKALYPVDLTGMILKEPLPVTKDIDLNYGEMLRYGSNIFAVAKNWPLIAIDIPTEKITEIETGPLQSLFVTHNGSLWGASTASETPFVRIDPISFNVKILNINYDGKEKTTVADSWSTWRKAPLAPAKNENTVFYATSPNASKIARLDLNTGDFNPDFIVLPSSNGQKQIIYGEGISVDPETGEIVITAVESGYGAHYKQNLYTASILQQGK